MVYVRVKHEDDYAISPVFKKPFFYVIETRMINEENLLIRYVYLDEKCNKIGEVTFKNDRETKKEKTIEWMKECFKELIEGKSEEELIRLMAIEAWKIKILKVINPSLKRKREEEEKEEEEDDNE
jgi:hypothetical protein